MSNNVAFQQILAFSPMALKALGVPQEKIDLVVATLKAPDLMLGDQPNMVKILELKSALEAIPNPTQEGRLVCGHCKRLNKF